jgi:hypothetical protein
MKAESKVLLAAGVVAAYFLAKKKGVISGVGTVRELAYDDYIVSTQDGRHAVEFQWMSDGDISVSAWYKGDGSNPQFDWDFWNHVGFYKTLAGAKRGAKKFMEERGHKLKDVDLNKVK